MEEIDNREVYIKFLETMERSFLVNQMTPAEREDIKNKYRDADADAISAAITGIEAADKANQAERVKFEERAEQAAEKLKLLSYEGERLLKKAEWPSPEEQKAGERDEIEGLENQLKQI